MIQTIDAAKGRPEAEHAIVDALKDRAKEAKDIAKDVLTGS